MDIYELRSYTRIRGTVHYLSARLERDPETGRIEGQTHTGRSFLDAHLINGDNTELSALLIPSFKSDLTTITSLVKSKCLYGTSTDFKSADRANL